jgi:type II secretory pathway pseudopilin PulG
MSRSTRSSRGFTLVELMISMAAGIMVALAVVALSREATNVFQDETRIAGAEMQLRSAMDRLRNDVQRASFMSTGNVYIDPAIYTGSSASATNNVQNIPAFYYTSAHMSLGSLAGVRLFAGGSSVGGGDGGSSQSVGAMSTLNGLSPDAIELGGYFTNVEELAVGGVSGHPAIEASSGGKGCGGQTVYLNVNSSPSIWRLVGLGYAKVDAAAPMNSSDYDTAINNAFQPVANTSFIVRLTNGSAGSIQNTLYAATCPDPGGTGVAAAWNNGVPVVYLSSKISIPTSFLGTSGENATINPVQIVRWEIQGAQISDPMSGEAGANGPKFDLTRQYLDATGTTAGSAETIAEYAVDLKFAFTEDKTTDTSGEYTGGSPPQVVYSFEDTTSNQAVAQDPTTAGADPQRIRAARIRIVTRAPTPDRSAALSAGTDYVYHYCVGTTNECDSGTNAPFFARARTLISEAALPNQARFWYK